MKMLNLNRLATFVTKFVDFSKGKRYLIASALFILAILLTKDYNLFVLIKKINTLRDLRYEEKYLKDKIERDSSKYTELIHDDKSFEKFAREQYYFHKANEDIFIIEYNKK